MEREIFSFLQFLIDEVETILIKNHFNQNLVIETFLENGFEAILSSRTNVLVFCRFLIDEVPFYEKVRQSVQNYLNQNLIIASFLEND